MVRARSAETTRAHKGGRKRGPNNAAHPLRLPRALLDRVDALLDDENAKCDEAGRPRFSRNQLLVMMLTDAATDREDKARTAKRTKPKS